MKHEPVCQPGVLRKDDWGFALFLKFCENKSCLALQDGIFLTNI
jgi:hypothetical protein